VRVTRIIMGMPITIEVVGARSNGVHDVAFASFEAVDRRFSPYRADSELSRMNAGAISRQEISDDMRAVLELTEQTRRDTDGYFDARRPDGTIDPSGIVKGWAILKVARLIAEHGATDFFVDAGGDIQAAGRNANGKPWSVGIRSPFDPSAVVKVIYPNGAGVATSGTYVRGQHIYDPHAPGRSIDDVVSLTVIGPDVLAADRFATAAFAMGKAGIGFIERLPGFEGYMIGADGRATMTGGFQAYTTP
jgi:thiamine biosynthesis lipoprotein